MASPERQPAPRDDEHRVIDFQSHAKRTPVPPSPDASALDRDATSGNRSAVNYRQRMIANLAAAIFAVILAATGVWLVSALNHMRQTQDCIAMGMRNCTDGSEPHS